MSEYTDKLDAWQNSFMKAITEGIRLELFDDFVFVYRKDKGGGTIASTTDADTVLEWITQMVLTMVDKKNYKRSRTISVDVSSGAVETLFVKDGSEEVN